ncbi:response regulator [Pseudomonas sp. GM25]|uniref:response regulator n=1 Tax=Pseudomonas sp. GM25 TaxID=1144327 RepID=UPI00026FFC7C|nr:response regulator [Pseudomonas sp. GM25]EJM27514.1 signal transduction histidine kinase [Pseudomonas sp. GM25]
MKLKQFLQPADAYFSTPKAARRLLRLFAQLLVLGMVAGAIVTLSSVFSSEISRRQGYMSDAITHARVFFTQREVLLRCLAFSALDKLNAANEAGVPNAARPWNLPLSQRAVEFLEKNRINLVYVADEPDFPAFYLNGGSAPIAPLSGDILQRLHRLGEQVPVVSQEVWMSDQSASPPRIYVFTLMDRSRAQSGWIGMEMDASDVTNTLHDDTAGQFMMLNASGEIMMSSAGVALPSPALRLEIGQNFGFSGPGAVPDRLVMRRQLGFSNWQIYYSIDLLSLMHVLWWPLAISIALIAFITLMVNRLVSRIERRLITPATERIDALIESEAFSRAVIQTAPVALCVLRRADGQVVLENRLSEQWLGECNERERLCHGWIERAFDENETNQSDEFQAGNGRHLYLSFVPTRYNGEDVLFCAFSDISSRKQVEAAMAMAKQMADAANEAKTLFLATMSHEIRTPLYGVLGTLELLGKTELKAQQKSYLHAIESSSTALLNLVCDVLDVAKIEAGQLALEIHDFSPVDLVYSVVQSYRGAARSKGLLLYSWIDPVLPAVLRGDVTRIRQILNNLLNNAVKFTDSGQVVLRVRAGAAAGDRLEVCWQVSDTGPGITHEDQVFLFEPFYQTGSATNVVAGTGLGLSICQRLALLMNGNIRVVSAAGLGSSFTLDVALERVSTTAEVQLKRGFSQAPVYVYSPVLEMAEYVEGWLRTVGARAQIGKPPLTGADPSAVLIEIHPEAQGLLCCDWKGASIVVSPDGCQTEGQTFNHWDVELNDLNGLFDAVIQAQGRVDHPQRLLDADVCEKLSIKVLVVEDNVINQLILKDQLQELGCQVVLASDASEALVLWAADDFDVILTDINMPGMNGYDLTRRLRSLGCTAPIIGATANAMRDERDRCLGAGMQQLLVKPFGLGALFNCLQHYERVNVDGL